MALNLEHDAKHGIDRGDVGNKENSKTGGTHGEIDGSTALSLLCANHMLAMRGSLWKLLEACSLL
jgi:hypothetical protein